MSLTREQIAERLMAAALKVNAELGGTAYEMEPDEREGFTRLADAVLALLAEARAEERERCVEIITRHGREPHQNARVACLEAAIMIRALGDAPGEQP